MHVLRQQYGFNVFYSRCFWNCLPEVFPGQTWTNSLRSPCTYSHAYPKPQYWQSDFILFALFLTNSVMFLYLYSLRHSAQSHNTPVAPLENHITLSHIAYLSQQTGLSGVWTGSRGSGVQQWLTSRRLQYPNLLLPSSPVNMKEKVSLWKNVYTLD